LALDVYVHRLRAGIAAMAASMAGMDVLAFTGGVGEHSAAVRALAGEGLRFLGVELDATRNETVTRDRDLSALRSHVRTVVIEAREDLEIARQVRTLLSR
jgi:acetate kinase